MLSDADILARRAWVGASEVSAIAGVNPYAGPLDVYLSKVLDGADLLRHAHRLDRELPIRIGNALEPTMLRLYEERYGRPIRARGQRWANDDLPFIAATLDGWDDVDQCPIECKWAGSRTRHHWTDEDDGIPIYYRVQVDIQLAVTGADFARVVAIVDGEERHYQIARDDALVSHWVEKARAFWYVNVKQKIEPEPRDPEELLRYLRSRHPREQRGVMLPATEDARQAASELRAAKEAAKAALAEVDKCKARLLGMVGDAEGIEDVCTLRTVRGSHVPASDRAAYRALRLKGDKET